MKWSIWVLSQDNVVFSRVELELMRGGKVRKRVEGRCLNGDWGFGRSEWDFRSAVESVGKR